MSYDKDGKPHIKETTTTTKNLNGVVEEKTRTLRDSDTGVEKINLKRRIGDKSKKVEKVRVGGGAIESSESTKGMTADEAATFDKDWKEATASTEKSGGSSHRLIKDKAKKTKQSKLLKD